MSIGARIRDLRQALRLKQGELARRAGIAQNTLSQIELGKTTPSVPTLEKIAWGLGVDLPQLLEEPAAAQQWQSVLANVRERQSEVEAKVDKLVEASAHSEVDPYEVKRVRDEIEDYESILLLALPGSQRQGRNQITINFSLVAPDQWDEFRNVSHFSEDIGKRLVEAGLAEWKERAGQKRELVPAGFGE